MKKTMSRSAVVVLALTCMFCAASSRPSAAQHPVEKLSWGFLNFKTPEYPWERYRETYIGISELYNLSSGFDVLFYDEVYKTAIGAPGTCFGLSLMSAILNERGGHLGFCAPPSQYSGDIFGGKGPGNDALRRALIETQGHQLNLGVLMQVMQMIGDKRATNGAQAFEDAKNIIGQGKLAVLFLTKNLKPAEGGHSIVGYGTEVVMNNNVQEKRILVYDPNRVWANESNGERGWYTGYTDGNTMKYVPPANYVKVFKDGVLNKWEFPMDGDNPWTGGDPNGGYLVALSTDLTAPRDRNPASLGFGSVNELKQIFVSGNATSLAQLSDAQGKRLYTSAHK